MLIMFSYKNFREGIINGNQKERKREKEVPRPFSSSDLPYSHRLLHSKASLTDPVSKGDTREK